MRHRVEFLRPRRHPLIGWVLLAMGVTALSGSLLVTRDWALRRGDVERAERARREQAQLAQVEAQRPVPMSAAEIRLSQVLPALRQPWLPMLAQVELSSEPPIFVLSLSAHPATGQLRIEAEAPSFSDALSYARSLKEGGVISGTQLRSHEVAADPLTSQPIVRFDVTAQWTGR